MKNVAINIKNNHGFTLIETMVAVSILAVAVAGPLLAANRAYNSAQLSRQQLIALNLAQEGIEYVRALRDNEYLSVYSSGNPNTSTVAWSNFLNGADSFSVKNCVSPTGSPVGTLVCTLDPNLTSSVGPNNSALQQCTTLTPGIYSACTNLYLVNNNVSDIYTQDSNMAVGDTAPGHGKTPYLRFIQIDTATTNIIKILVEVDWSYHGQAYKVQLKDQLTPWQ